MRYMKHTVTGAVEAVAGDDDERFEELKSERFGDGRPVWEQTGAHDPAVLQVEISGQHPANGEENEAPGASTTDPPIEQLAHIAIDQVAILREQLADAQAALAERDGSNDADDRVAELERQLRTLREELEAANTKAARAAEQNEILQAKLAVAEGAADEKAPAADAGGDVAAAARPARRTGR